MATANEDGGFVDPEAFAFFSLTGDRFDAPGMPADTAREVGYFKDAVLQAAREVWLERNPDRKRVPEGFNLAFDLRLTAVDEGSARPRLVLRKPAKVAEPQWDEWSEIYGEARDLVAGTLGQVVATGQTPSGLSPQSRAALKRVGGSLKPAEKLRVGHPADPQRRTSLDESTRRILAQIDEELPQKPEEHTLEGVIVEYDGVKLSFTLRTDAGLSTCVLEHFNTALANRVRDVLALDGVTAPDVSVVGETLDPSAAKVHLFNVNRIDLVRSVKEKALAARMGSLRELEDGWNGPGSLAPDAAVLDRVDVLVGAINAAAIPVDAIPAANGSVVLEWSREAVEFSATLTSAGTMQLIADNTVTDELAEVEVDFDPTLFQRFLSRGMMT